MGTMHRCNARGVRRSRAILPSTACAVLATGSGLIAGGGWGGQAFAQAPNQPLPPVTVEGGQPKAKKKAAAPKPAPKPAPAPVVQPQPPVDPQTAREQAQQDAPYQAPAAVSTATKSDINTFGQIDTGDVLRAMPGTYTRESPNNPGVAVNIRGLEGSGRVT